DVRAKGDNLPFIPMKKVGLDPLVRGDGEPRELLFPGRESLDRALPADLRRGLSEQSIGSKIVDRDGYDEPFDSRGALAQGRPFDSRGALAPGRAFALRGALAQAQALHR